MILILGYEKNNGFFVIDMNYLIEFYINEMN